MHRCEEEKGQAHREGRIQARTGVSQIVDGIQYHTDFGTCDDVVQKMLSRLEHEVKATVTPVKPSGSAGRKRFSPKLPGFGNLIEYCTSPTSNLGNAACSFKGVSVTRITKSEDIDNPRTHKQLRKLIRAAPGTSIHGSLPCTP